MHTAEGFDLQFSPAFPKTPSHELLTNNQALTVFRIEKIVS